MIRFDNGGRDGAVRPSVPDELSYPDKWQLTALAFPGFLGAYIILSLTISPIREQASI